MLSIEKINRTCQDFIENSALNKLPEFDQMMIFKTPLIGVASANDPLFARLKEAVAPHHRSPEEWLPSAQSIISFFLPFTEDIVVSNREMGDTSLLWLMGRHEGGDFFMPAFSKMIEETLTANHYKAVTPAYHGDFNVIDKKSNWSERHAAFVAGLGTFGRHGALISRAGSSGRIASVITDWHLEPTQRDYTGLFDYCIDCYQCIPRRDFDAITREGGKNHDICSQKLDGVTRIKYAPRYGCGKCNTNVPCEMERP